MNKEVYDEILKRYWHGVYYSGYHFWARDITALWAFGSAPSIKWRLSQLENVLSLSIVSTETGT